MRRNYREYYKAKVKQKTYKEQDKKWKQKHSQ